MPGNVLTISSTVLCLHGGSAILTTANSKVMADNALALLESDVHTVAGCPFQIPVGAGTKPSPCIRIRVVWRGGADASQRSRGAGPEQRRASVTAPKAPCRARRSSSNTQMKVSAQ